MARRLSSVLAATTTAVLLTVVGAAVAPPPPAPAAPPHPPAPGATPARPRVDTLNMEPALARAAPAVGGPGWAGSGSGRRPGPAPGLLARHAPQPEVGRLRQRPHRDPREPGLPPRRRRRRRQRRHLLRRRAERPGERRRLDGGAVPRHRDPA